MVKHDNSNSKDKNSSDWMSKYDNYNNKKQELSEDNAARRKGLIG